MTLDSNQNFEDREREFEDQIAFRYNRDYHAAPLMAWHSEMFIAFIKSKYKRGDRILDLGCGPASLWTELKAQLPDMGALVGVDLSPAMIDEARLLHPDGDFRVGSMFSIPAIPGEFDLVIVSSAFHHVPDKELPRSLLEISRVMDEHGSLVGREPLMAGRVGDRGGWFAGALMNLRHLAYRLTHTREYPEPDPGPAHHAYAAANFFEMINATFAVSKIEFRNPVSPFLSRVQDRKIVEIAKILDESVKHKEGQEVHYVAEKNYADFQEVHRCVELAIKENKIENLAEFLAMVDAAAAIIEKHLTVDSAANPNQGSQIAGDTEPTAGRE
ncbi:MAG: class I SAM-dependent methyltransferase [Limnohabitans sp.]|uniref:class I SAM-dependent methyltransferase n=1 Tax=Limnohabitans sp. TaxID=1907725 RepID=UPI0025D4AE97|nr:class I SAM-dependent methyltransferase [Limnohabitans sp.]MCO4089674.1 class I SAM-dependent methyltransferase [Limnohabitans sp.]